MTAPQFTIKTTNQRCSVSSASGEILSLFRAQSSVYLNATDTEFSLVEGALDALLDSEPPRLRIFRRLPHAADLLDRFVDALLNSDKGLPAAVVEDLEEIARRAPFGGDPDLTYQTVAAASVLLYRFQNGRLEPWDPLGWLLVERGWRLTVERRRDGELYHDDAGVNLIYEPAEGSGSRLERPVPTKQTKPGIWQLRALPW